MAVLIFTVALPQGAVHHALNNIQGHSYSPIAATPVWIRERRRLSHASTETRPCQAALLASPESQPHQCVGGNTIQLVTDISLQAPGPPKGVARAQWDKDIPAGQTLL